MQIYDPDTPSPLRQLAPFILLSLLFHIPLLLAIRPRTKDAPVVYPIAVYFSTPAAIYKSASIPMTHTFRMPAEKHVNPARILTSSKSQTPQIAAQSTLQVDPHRVINSQQFLESAKSIARDEARKTEQRIAAMENKKLNTPAGTLAQDLQQPQTEIHLANGILKIVTDAGAVCFQPVPSFAHDQPGLYGIPTTCP